VQQTGEPILTLYVWYDLFLCKELTFGVTMIAPTLKLLVALFF